MGPQRIVAGPPSPPSLTPFKLDDKKERLEESESWK